jgi:hypothetical protein
MLGDFILLLYAALDDSLAWVADRVQIGDFILLAALVLAARALVRFAIRRLTPRIARP